MPLLTRPDAVLGTPPAATATTPFSAPALALAILLASLPAAAQVPVNHTYEEIPIQQILRDFADDPGKAAATYRHTFFLTDFRIRTVASDPEWLWTVAVDPPPESAGEIPPGTPEIRCRIPANASDEEGEAARNYRPGDTRTFTASFSETDGKVLYFMCIDFGAFLESLEDD
ncbi:MAG: hypothetical protein LBT40_12470 [Deltaproteobacteria bacterium]|jgi:hypothetical protein|nr:hypothetical protein [Deltaproteobacteria bacterium]